MRRRAKDPRTLAQLFAELARLHRDLAAVEIAIADHLEPTLVDAGAGEGLARPKRKRTRVVKPRPTDNAMVDDLARAHARKILAGRR